MAVAFDTSYLIPLLDKNARVEPVIRRSVNLLVTELQKTGDRILIPTPALAEFLVKATDAAPAYLDRLTRSRHFELVPFGIRAAVQLAAAEAEARAAGDKRDGTGADWTKVKFDRQIVATAVAEHATCIYSNDRDIRAYARRFNIPVIAFADLPEPPLTQTDMFVEGDDKA